MIRRLPTSPRTARPRRSSSGSTRPGGTVVGGETLYSRLRQIAENKPIVAVMGEIATSAAYMTAIGSDYIVAHDGTLTGSIGVILQTADVTGLLDKIGIKPESVKSSPLKAQPNPLEPFTPDAREATQQGGRRRLRHVCLDGAGAPQTVARAGGQRSRTAACSPAGRLRLMVWSMFSAANAKRALGSPRGTASLDPCRFAMLNYADQAKSFATWSAASSEKLFCQKGLLLTGWCLSGTLRTDLHDADRM